MFSDQLKCASYILNAPSPICSCNRNLPPMQVSFSSARFSKLGVDTEMAGAPANSSTVDGMAIVKKDTRLEMGEGCA